jgi:hypothetical protein
LGTQVKTAWPGAQGGRIWKKGPFNPIEIEVEIEIEIGSKRFSFLFWAEL